MSYDVDEPEELEVDVADDVADERDERDEPDMSISDGERSLVIDKLRFSVEDNEPVAKVEGVEIRGLFEPGKNPLQALLNNFNDIE